MATFIRSLGLKTILQLKKMMPLDLDFVIEDPKKKRFGIGIECDAHCHPILETARDREVWRPKVLRKGIPHVHRSDKLCMVSSKKRRNGTFKAGA